MPALTSAPVDMIEELMHRCWARKNYLPLELREKNWHPIILEEMASRDEELSAEPIRQGQFTQPRDFGFVPLVPNVTHFVHPGQAEIREPHYLASTGSPGSFYTDSIYAGGLI